jgi:hypothetical protein
MEPTISEIIFLAVLAIIGWGFIIFAVTRPSDHIDITESKRRDWEREERKWR